MFSALCSKDYLYTVSPSPAAAAAAEAAVSQIAADTARPGICAKDAPMEWLFAFPLIQIHPSLAFLCFLRFLGALVVVCCFQRGSSTVLLSGIQHCELKIEFGGCCRNHSLLIIGGWQVDKC